MIIALLAVAIIAIILGVVLDNCTSSDAAPAFLIGGGVILGIVCAVGMLFCSIGLSQNVSIDDKIMMYEEENLQIEDDIDELVVSYMEYEEKVQFTAASGNYMTLISMYPDLKADTLVQEQIRIHTENNEKIKELKELKLDMAVYKWWLYFGK